MHVVVAGHETPFRYELAPPETLGVGSILHVAPFHASARVWIPETLSVPTAVQSAVETHEIAVKRLSVAPVGLGVGTSVQLFPFQSSATVMTPVLVLANPTAMHEVDVVHETAGSTKALGLGSPVRLVPFHDTAVARPAIPTATQELADVHETDVR
jgi:hypothetical protein